MNDIKSLNKSKLFKLKEWLTVSDAARHLSTVFEEEVTKADVFRLALDNHLKLSVNFVNHAYVRRGKIVSYEETEWFEYCPQEFLPKLQKQLPTDQKNKPVKMMKSLAIDKTNFINLNEKVTVIEGVWDLSMIGNEQIDIEHEYQVLTGGPEISLIGLDGPFVEREGGIICQVQEQFDEKLIKYQKSEERTQKSLDYYRKALEKRVANNEIDEEEVKKLLKQRKINLSRKRTFEDDFFPAGTLPDDSVLVVRTQALIDLQESLSTIEPTEGKTLKTATPPLLNSNHPFFAKELKIAHEAWTELYEKNPPSHVPQGGHIKYITNWLKKNHPRLTQRAQKRIATIINPNPKGGASPIE